jgi:two-component system chemotaxis response regulator CheY
MSPEVLIADDDDFIRRLVTTTLEDVSGVRLVEARDGLEAVELALRTRPALILLDVAMPGLDGIEACRRLRAEPATSETPIVMLTAHAGDDDEARAVAAGADRYLTKPFSPLDLLRLVDELPASERR